MSNTADSVEDKTNSELKAGHAPATKVGGMRVPAPRRTSRSEDKAATNPTEGQTNETNASENATSGNTEGEQQAAADEDEEAANTVAQRQSAGQMVGGQFVRIQDAFPTEAVRQIHEKHFDNVPKHEAHNRSSHHDVKVIVQPRKM